MYARLSREWVEIDNGKKQKKNENWLRQTLKVFNHEIKYVVVNDARNL